MRSRVLLLVAAIVLAVVGVGTRFLLTAAQAEKPEGHWTSASALPVGVVSHAATLLPNGNVLITGGEDATYSRPTAYAQLYHVKTGKWSTVASMHAARIGHTATLLGDGRVLVAGGLGKKLQGLRTAEVYDPASDTWTLTSPLSRPRFSHSATLLSDGKVLVVGGIVGHTISRSTLLFDPRTLRWTSGPPTLYPHAQQAAVTLPGGRVLVAGGYGGKAEVFDEKTARWSEVGGPGLRAHPVVTLLPNGDVLFASGVDNLGHPFVSTSLFNSRTDRWNGAATMQVGRDTPIGTELRDGRVLVAGGAAKSQMLKSAEIYSPRTNSWATAGQMIQGRTAATGILLHNGKVLVCGGTWFGSVLNSCELYTP